MDSSTTPNPWRSFHEKVTHGQLSLTNRFDKKEIQTLSTTPVPSDFSWVPGIVIRQLVNNTNYDIGSVSLLPRYLARLMHMFAGFDGDIVHWETEGYTWTPLIYCLYAIDIDIEKNYKVILDACQFTAVSPVPSANMDIIIQTISNYHKVRRISSPEDIEAIVESEEEVIISFCYDYRILFRHCVFPEVIPNRQFLVDYLSGMDDDFLTFWHDEISSSIITSYIWKYISFEEAKKIALESSDSLPLIIHTGSSPKYFYPSMRPKTDMSIFRSIYNRKASYTDLALHTASPLTYKISIDDMEWIAIPVTRYAKGMSKGLYYHDNAKELAEKYCGTFYYAEGAGVPATAASLEGADQGSSPKRSARAEEGGWSPQTATDLKTGSSTYLLVQPSRYMVSFNKTDAMIKLGEQVKDINPNIIKHMNGEIPEDLIMTPQELVALGEGDAILASKMAQTPRYAGAMMLYALEDGYDQPLCIAASKKGIDVIILTHMAGSFKVVTEVLDTRDRKMSFRSLLYTDI